MILTLTAALVLMVVFLISVFCFKCLYDIQTKYFGFWEEQNVKQVEPKFPFGSFKICEMNLLENEMKFYKEYGRIYGRFDGNLPVLTVADRDLIGKILLSDFNKFPNRRDMAVGDPIFDSTLFSLEGKDWKRVRNIVKVGFLHSNLKKMMTLLLECCDKLNKKLEIHARERKVVNCQKHFGVFVLHTIGRCAFGVRINDDDPFIKNANMLFSDNWRTILIVCMPWLMKFCKVTILNTKTTNFYKQVMSKVIEARKKIKKEKCNDFLQRMLDYENKSEDANNNDQAGLTHDEMLSQCVSFFLAGYEATTSVLSHCLYRFAVNPECQQKVFDEMQRVMLKRSDQKEDLMQSNEDMFADLGKLKYLDAVMKECLRLCPPMARIERRAAEDYCFKDVDIHLKEGFLVSIPVFAMHHDPELYPDPEIFNPERFYEGDHNQFKNIYFPFGSGGRECVGKNFVIMQVKLCLVKLVMNFKILPAPTTPATLKIIEMRNVLKVDDVDVILETRTTS